MKRSTWKKRALASALALTMAASVLPMAGFAAGGSGTGTPLAETGSLGLSKTATLENDGTYTIRLEAFSTGEVTTVSTQTPTDIVLVLDVSGSMDENFTYTSGQQWTSVKDTVASTPGDAYHHCPDGSYSPIEWTETGWGGLGRYRYVCTHCLASRKWDSPTLINHIPGEGDDDSWNLWRYTDITETKAKLPALKEAVNTFLAGVADENAAINDTNLQHQVAIVKFASEDTKSNIGNDTYYSGVPSYGYYNYTQTVSGMTTVTSENLSELTGRVNNLEAGGATAADKGLQMAQGILNDTDAGRNKVVILFTDGEPTYGSDFESYVANSAVRTAKALKGNDTTVYTIGVVSGANPADTKGKTNAYLNAVSSNYPNAKSYTDLGDGGDNGYYKTIGTSGSLTNIFEEIEQDITTTTVELDANAQLRDVLNNGFVLTPDSQVTVQTDTYTGRDKRGNRVFANNPETFNATVSKDLGSNTVTVSGFDFSTKYLVDGSDPDENDFTAAKQGEKLIVTITGVEARDPAVTNDLVSTNTRSSGIYEDSDATVPFARFPQPMTQLSSKVYVLDYAKPADLTGMPNATTHMDGDGMNYFASANKNLVKDYGTVSENTYTPTTMQWDGYDQYYVFGKWNTIPEGVTTGSNTWTKVTVMPANNVYYEDNFMVDTEGSGIVYSGKWDIDGSSAGNTETANNDIHGGWVQGDNGLSDDTGYSDGSAHQATGKATASFTFTGTGVDVYTRTKSDTLTVIAQLVSQNSGDAPKTQTLIMNNQSTSGDYYQIPTLSFAGLNYGTYTVTIYVSASSGTYYLDGIRVYNPIQGLEEEALVAEAYGEELGAAFTEVRDILLDAAKLNGKTNFDGALFIDKDKDTGTSVVGDYEDYGPKNEVYLARNQSIAFTVEGTGPVYIGLKAPNGHATVNMTNENGVTGDVPIDHSTDLYYKVVPNSEGQIVIQNVGEGLLSITKLRVTGGGAVGESSLTSLMSYMSIMDTLPEVPYVNDDTGATDEGGNVDIENPDQDQSQEAPTQGNSFLDILKDIFESIWNLF